MSSIYLDHNATTPIHPDVVEAMRLCYSQALANPTSQHRPGQQTRKLLEDARERIAEILGARLHGAEADRLIFTGSATQANNLAILGMARAGGPEPGQVIISAIEHSSVIEPAEHLLEQGWDYDGLPVTGEGVVRVEMLPGLLSEKTRLVSVTLGNHETGVLQPVGPLAEMCNQAGVPLHTDAVQVAGKLPVDFRALGVAAMSIGAHKFRGPVGIGALILRHDVKIEPITFGGPHEQALWPGTQAVVLAVGMCTALELWQRDHESHLQHLAALRDRFEQSLRSAIPEVIIHGRQRFDRAFAHAAGHGTAHADRGQFAAIQFRGHQHPGGNRRGGAPHRGRVWPVAGVNLDQLSLPWGIAPEPFQEARQAAAARPIRLVASNRRKIHSRPGLASLWRRIGACWQVLEINKPQRPAISCPIWPD